jgi:hypothetical protein
MNTGLQDAYNLAWKLALVVQGRAQPALLDSYEAERIPVARRLLRTTDRVFRIIVAEGWFGALFRTTILARVAAAAMRIEPVRRLAFRTISQIGISYPHSMLSLTRPGLPRGAPVAGDRFPWLRIAFTGQGAADDLYRKLDDSCFNLLVFGQPALRVESGDAFADLLRVHAIPRNAANDAELARAGISQPSFYLLRPDGHVGLCGMDLNDTAIRDYLSQRVHLGARFGRADAA